MAAVDELCPLACVRASCAAVVDSARDVRVDAHSVAAVATHWTESKLVDAKPAFDRKLHFVDETRPALTVQARLSASSCACSQCLFPVLVCRGRP